MENNNNILMREYRRRKSARQRTQLQRKYLDDQYLYTLLKLSGSLYEPENQQKIKLKRKYLQDWRHQMSWKRDSDRMLVLAKLEHDKLKQLIKKHYDNKH
jgi:hypothetical protein